MFLYHWKSVFWTKYVSDVKALRKWTCQISLLVQGLSNAADLKKILQTFQISVQVTNH